MALYGTPVFFGSITILLGNIRPNSENVMAQLLQPFVKHDHLVYWPVVSFSAVYKIREQTLPTSRQRARTRRTVYFVPHAISRNPWRRDVLLWFETSEPFCLRCGGLSLILDGVHGVETEEAGRWSDIRSAAQGRVSRGFKRFGWPSNRSFRTPQVLMAGLRHRNKPKLSKCVCC